jgi:hypothetical protein
VHVSESKELEGYLLLDDGDQICEGDEYCNQGQWVKIKGWSGNSASTVIEAAKAAFGKVGGIMIRRKVKQDDDVKRYWKAKQA